MVIYFKNLTIEMHIFYILICASNSVQIGCLIDEVTINL